jgi:hypothetical protein
MLDGNNVFKTFKKRINFLTKPLNLKLTLGYKLVGKLNHLNLQLNCLGQNNNDLEYFGFKFIQDTLELYNLNCLNFDSTDNRCVEVELGQQTHKLWRKK